MVTLKINHARQIIFTYFRDVVACCQQVCLCCSYMRTVVLGRAVFFLDAVMVFWLACLTTKSLTSLILLGAILLPCLLINSATLCVCVCVSV